jgi:hypothetical protein
MQREFADKIHKFCLPLQQAAEDKINREFAGKWRVHVVKLKVGLSKELEIAIFARVYGTLTSSVYGTWWYHKDGYFCYIMRES